MARTLRGFRAQLIAAIASAASPCLLGACCTGQDYSRTLPIIEDAGDASPADGDASADAQVEDAAPMTTTEGGMDACLFACRGADVGCTVSGTLVGCTFLTGPTGRSVRCDYHSVTCPTHPVLLGPVCGRRPEGFECDPTAVGFSLGDVFARLAFLEAASVPAFERLANELEHHGADERLVRAARRAADDEVRHTASMRRLAERHGASITEPPATPTAIRDLESIAIENAREGCVRETFGALVAAYQSLHAEHADVRAAMKSIARDEAKHAWLALEIDTWIRARLDAGARARVEHARREAIRELERQAPGVATDAATLAAGFPGAEACRALLRGARESVWS